MPTSEGGEPLVPRVHGHGEAEVQRTRDAGFRVSDAQFHHGRHGIWGWGAMEVHFSLHYTVDWAASSQGKPVSRRLQHVKGVTVVHLYEVRQSASRRRPGDDHFQKETSAKGSHPDTVGTCDR